MAKFDLFNESLFFAILELCAFYIECKNAKLRETSFRGRNNVKHFMQTQLSRFCKDTAKASSIFLLKTATRSTHFLPVVKREKVPKKDKTAFAHYLN